MFLTNPCVTDPRVHNEARSLVQAGHKVTVIAWDRYKQNQPLGFIDGIEIVQVKTWLSARWGLGIVPWHFFHLFSWQWRAYRLAESLHKESNFDVIHCHDFDTLPVGVLLKRKRGLPLVYDAHELYGYMAMGVAPAWVGRLIMQLEKQLIAKTDRIITVSEATRRYFAGITDKPILIVMNCKQLQSIDYQPPDGNDRFTVIYIGLIDKARALSLLINVVKQLPDVDCIIGGYGQQDYIATINNQSDKLPNAKFVGLVPFDKVLPMTGKADAIFCMFDPTDPNSKIGTPNKLFEAMVCGRPIICTKGTYSGELAEQEGVGLAVEYTEEALKQAIIKLRDNPELRERLGRNGLKAAIEKYNWPEQAEKLVDLYDCELTK